MLKFSGLVLSGLPELFSGLFYVAASRLNSPRFPVVLIRRDKRDCQAVIREGREHLNAESLMVGKGVYPRSVTQKSHSSERSLPDHEVSNLHSSLRNLRELLLEGGGIAPS